MQYQIAQCNVRQDTKRDINRSCLAQYLLGFLILRMINKPNSNKVGLLLFDSFTSPPILVLLKSSCFCSAIHGGYEKHNQTKQNGYDYQEVMLKR